MHPGMQHHGFLLVDLAEEEEQQQLGTVSYLRPRPNKHMLVNPCISSNLDLCQYHETGKAFIRSFIHSLHSDAAGM